MQPHHYMKDVSTLSSEHLLNYSTYKPFMVGAMQAWMAFYGMCIKMGLSLFISLRDMGLEVDEEVCNDLIQDTLV